jgi:uncharacterized protein (TIGR02001 family)
MKSVLAALALTLTFGTMAAQAQEAASPLSFNISLTNDYRYRGVSQSRLDPALQGGADYAFASGFYIGSWLSTIKWVKDAGGNSDVEIDVYGGYKTEIAPGLTGDVGVLTYAYPSNKLSPSADTTEIYGALTYGPVTAKYSYSTTNLFGFANSKGSGYVDVSASFDLGDGYSLAPHVGYTDYSLQVSKEFSGFLLSGGVAGTDNKTYVSPAGKNLGKAGVLVSVKKSF